MTQPVAGALTGPSTGPPRPPSPYAPGPGGQSANLADILERVLDKGVVIAGDIRINLLDIELLTIKLRLLVVSVDKAKEMGIDWWEHDPSLSSRAGRTGAGETHGSRADETNRSLAGDPARPSAGERALAEENERLRAEIAALRADSVADRRLQP